MGYIDVGQGFVRDYCAADVGLSVLVYWVDLDVLE